MPDDKLVVHASDAKFSKSLMGAFQVAYPCPRCTQELMTKNEALMTGDCCPHCKVSFVFDDRIQQAFAVLLAEKRSKEERKLADKTAKEKLIEAERHEHQRRYEQLLQKDREREKQEKERRNEMHARDISVASGIVMTTAVLGWIGAGFVLFASLVCAVNPEQSHRSQGLLTTGVASLVSVNVFFAFFRILEAIHAVLVKILDRSE
jgi:hypothetical protein